MASRDSHPSDTRLPSNPEGFEDTAVGVDPLIGQLLGEYKVLERIGEGGMGVVYRGLHPTIKKRVAIKVLKPSSDDPQQKRRLVTEAEAVNAVAHRDIIDIFGHGTLEDGRHYLVMEFLDGEPLDRVLARRGRLPWPEACALLIELCRPLQAAHARGVIHRDLKPSNIFVVRRDGAPGLKLLDFGLAKLTESAFESTQQSNVMQVSGTPAYMAPEQTRALPVSASTDLYALGVIAFELFAGKVPFDDQNPMDVMMAHVTREPPSLAALAPKLPPLLHALVAQLLAKEPAHRPASAEAVRATLEEALASNSAQAMAPTDEVEVGRALGLDAPRAPSSASQLPKTRGPRRAAPVLLLAAAAAVAGVAAVSLWPERSASVEQPVAAPRPLAPLEPLAPPAPPVVATPEPASTPPTPLAVAKLEPVPTPPAPALPVPAPPAPAPPDAVVGPKPVPGEPRTPRPRPRVPTADELMARIASLRQHLESQEQPNGAYLAHLQALGLQAAAASSPEACAALEQKVKSAERKMR